MRIKKGVVTSNSMEKTIVVRVDTYKTHPKYEKKYRDSKKFYVHVEDSSAYEIGSQVVIAETIPTSKLKRWRIANKSEQVAINN